MKIFSATLSLFSTWATSVVDLEIASTNSFVSNNFLYAVLTYFSVGSPSDAILFAKPTMADSKNAILRDLAGLKRLFSSEVANF